MTSERLEQKCLELFGSPNGEKLFEAMLGIAKKDLCVATSWDSDQVSIARSCSMRGRVFQLTSDYESIIIPNEKKFRIDKLVYSDIVKYLPISYGKQFHCSFDDKS